jgi:hypothetical protein
MSFIFMIDQTCQVPFTAMDYCDQENSVLSALDMCQVVEEPVTSIFRAGEVLNASCYATSHPRKL